ncbi:stage III sporulation protein AE [Paenibacillus beijingensis]|uniref:stage III sporulation protein AE n=1 Tax=Paenibacillus beijingensis TaxID=1126833 RepID=UPI0009E55C79|nr:stage III sporulation protein AE [Paenibacillus beijingensis]
MYPSRILRFFTVALILLIGHFFPQEAAAAADLPGTDTAAVSTGGSAPSGDAREGERPADVPVNGAQEGADVAGRLAAGQVESSGTDEVEAYWNRLVKQYGGYFPDRQLPGFIEMITPGGDGLKLSSVIKGLLSYALHEVLYNGKLVVSIVLLAVFSSMLETLQSAFERNAVSKVAYSVAYMVLIVLAVNSFYTAIGYAKDAIGGMIQFMMAMVPLLLTLIASTGSLATVTILHPVIVFMVHTVGTLIYSIVFPLLFFSAVLHIASSLSEKFKVTQLANLLRNIGAGLLGVMLTVFLGVISFQGAAGTVADSVTLRTAKFVSSSFVPVVGRAFSDAADTVISASMLAKNAIGLAGVIILLFLCAFPAIKILTLALIYNVSAAVLQPLGNSPVTACLQTIGKTMLLVFGALGAVALMFFLAVTIILTAGNAMIMMR